MSDLLLSDLPLAPKPYRVERNAWERTADGGAEYCGFEAEHQVGRFDTLAEAIAVADTHLGNVKVYLMHVGRNGGEIGGPVYDNWLTTYNVQPQVAQPCVVCGDPCLITCRGCGVFTCWEHRQTGWNPHVCNLSSQP